MLKRIRALLATARIANVPSVVCNVLTGWVIGYILTKINDISAKMVMPIWLLAITGCVLYIGGNFLNDWKDAEWDKKHRPERALPSGKFSSKTYLGIAVTLILSGFVCLLSYNFAMSVVYALITVLVICYTILHKKYRFSIWLMGACRGGLYALGMASWDNTFVLDYYRHDGAYLLLNLLIYFPIVGMITYIAGISLLARYESSGMIHGSSKLIGSLLLLFPILTHACVWVLLDYLLENSRYLLVIFGAAIFSIWTIILILKKYSISQKVSHLLAGIALVDSVFIWSGSICLGNMITHIYPINDLQLLFPLIAFLLALLLQKIAPAT